MTVTVNVLGVQAVTSINLIYNAGQGEQTVKMTGTKGVYTATIPAMPDKTKVSYKVKVVNAAGYETVSDAKEYTVGDPVLDYSVLVFNEIYGAGEDNEKFMELYNNGNVDLPLKGLTINKDEELSWTGKAGEVIPAKGHFLIIGAKNTNPEGGFSSGLSAKKSIILELFDANGNKLDTFQRGEKGTAWGDQALDSNKGSWSRIPDGSGDWFIVEVPTGGKANDETGKKEDPALVISGKPNKPAEPVIDYHNLVFNEIYGAGEDNEKFMELYNNGEVELSLEGVIINKDEELSWTGKAGEVIPAKGHFLIVGAKNTNPEGGFSSGLSSKKSLILELFDAKGNKLDTFQRGQKGTGWGDEALDNNKGSWSRIPDGTGDWFIVEVITGGKANDETGKKEDPALVK